MSISYYEYLVKREQGAQPAHASPKESIVIIDAHNHLTDDFDPAAAGQYIESLRQAGVERVMICPISHERWGGNPAPLELAQRFPEAVVAFAYIDLDRDSPEDAQRYREQGYAGLKVIQTSRPYDDERYLEHYRAAAQANLPVLFHSGFLGLRPGRYVRCDHYRPITLDTIARHFPQLRMICAHMGNPWWEEAFLVMWKHRNIYCDMSGLSACRRDLDSWVRLFKPNGELHEAANKLIFASDQFLFGSTSYSTQYIDYHDRLFGLLGLDDGARERIYSGNFLQLLSR
jgi:predicted TIM-barrel fold metal-dependent hydrolase